MEFVINWPDVNGDARLASGRTDNLKTQYASFPILLPLSKDNNNSSSTRIMNSSGQIAIAFVCALVLVLTHQQHLTLLCLMVFINRRREGEQEIGNVAGAVTHISTIPITTRAPGHFGQDWWERVVIMEFTDTDWRDNFRMSRQSFAKLCRMMERVTEPCEVTIRTPVPTGMHVAMVLYKLASCAEYRVIANQFGVQKRTVKKMVYLFCHGMVDSVIKTLIRVPTLEEACAIAERFERAHSIPQIIGCVDGSHIPCLPPSDGYRDFINRKGWPSHILQGVCDDKYCFWSVSCKMPGSAHDATALRQFHLFQNAHSFPKRAVQIEGQDVDFFLLGDPAYPLMPWLMKGYLQSPRLAPQEESFNVYLSSARTSIEIAFGRLKSRFRVLLKHSDFHFTFTPFMVATCALHNFCEMEKEHVNPRWAEEATSAGRQFPQPVTQANRANNSAATAIRRALTDYLVVHVPLHRR